MHKLLKVIGWVLMVPAIIMVIMLPFAIADPEGRDAIAGLIMIAAFFGIPAGLVLRSGYKKAAEEELETQMVGFVRSRDAFAIDELAAHIGKAPAQAQTLLHRDIARYHLPLVLHRSSGRYLRLDRLSQAAQVAERCQSCGGSLGTQVVFEGEQLTCPYCGVLVSTHAPAQANWSGAQGAWAHQAWGHHQGYGQQQHAGYGHQQHAGYGHQQQHHQGHGQPHQHHNHHSGWGQQ